MNPLFANQYSEIPAALAANRPLADVMLALVAGEPIPGKVTEGEGRVEALRAILTVLTNGMITSAEAVRRAEAELPRDSSPHAHDNRVFASGWAERLVRTQFSRFYNQAVLNFLAVSGEAECVVPHSSEEKPDSQCSRLLAGRTHRVADLLALLVSSYSNGQFSKTPKVPDHPHCTHVVRPVEAG